MGFGGLGFIGFLGLRVSGAIKSSVPNVANGCPSARLSQTQQHLSTGFQFRVVSFGISASAAGIKSGETVLLEEPAAEANEAKVLLSSGYKSGAFAVCLSTRSGFNLKMLLVIHDKN